MSMIEDIKELGKLGYTKDEINQIVGFKSATTAPVGEVKTEPEQKVENKEEAKEVTPGIQYPIGTGIEPIVEEKKESPKETDGEVIAYIKSLEAKLDSLQRTQQASNTAMQIEVAPIKTAGEMLDALSR